MVMKMKSITCKELFTKYYLNYDYVIIDLRNRMDFSKGHIPNSYNIPYEMFMQKYYYYLNSSKTYLLICEGGERSKKCTELLLKNNYKAINISDGFIHWKGPIEKSQFN